MDENPPGSSPPFDPDALVERALLPAFFAGLTGVWVPATTWATKATRGGAPPHIRFNGRAHYRLGGVVQHALAHGLVPVGGGQPSA